MSNESQKGKAGQQVQGRPQQAAGQDRPGQQQQNNPGAQQQRDRPGQQHQHGNQPGQQGGSATPDSQGRKDQDRQQRG